MFDKIRDYCDIKFEKTTVDIGYYIVLYLYMFIQIGLFVLFGFLFNNWYFIVIGSIVSNLVNYYSYTHHCHKLENCIFITQLFFIVFGILSKTIPTEWSFIFAIISIIEIYGKAPLEITLEDKSEEWLLYRIMRFLIVFLALSLVALYFNHHEITNSILWSIIMTNCLMIKNKLERV